MKFLKAFWLYLGKHQSPTVRIVHLLVLLLVIMQIAISNFMHVPRDSATPMHGANAVFSWLHIGSGILLLCLTLLLAALCFCSRGLRYYFPYLFGDVSQLRHDMGLLFSRRFPGAQAGGLAACVQGLGLGAMALVVLSGVTWLGLWLSGQSLAPDAQAWHQALTGLVEAYICGHGGMGLLHFYLERRQGA